jgi:hypothetical protein
MFRSTAFSPLRHQLVGTLAKSRLRGPLLEVCGGDTANVIHLAHVIHADFLQAFVDVEAVVGCMRGASVVVDGLVRTFRIGETHRSRSGDSKHFAKSPSTREE